MASAGLVVRELDLAVVSCSTCQRRVTAALPERLIPDDYVCGACTGPQVPLGIVVFRRALEAADLALVEAELLRQIGGRGTRRGTDSTSTRRPVPGPPGTRRSRGWSSPAAQWQRHGSTCPCAAVGCVA